MFDLIWTQRSHDIHVCLKQDAALWACGKTLDEALGNWLRTHGADFSVSIKKAS